jgi:hypothetical protein
MSVPLCPLVCASISSQMQDNAATIQRKESHRTPRVHKLYITKASILVIFLVSDEIGLEEGKEKRSLCCAISCHAIVFSSKKMYHGGGKMKEVKGPSTVCRTYHA